MTEATVPRQCRIGFHEWEIQKYEGGYPVYRFHCGRSGCQSCTEWKASRFNLDNAPELNIGLYEGY